MLRKTAEFFYTRFLCVLFGIMCVIGGVIYPQWVVKQIIEAIEEFGWHHHARSMD